MSKKEQDEIAQQELQKEEALKKQQELAQQELQQQKKQQPEWTTEKEKALKVEGQLNQEALLSAFKEHNIEIANTDGGFKSTNFSKGEIHFDLEKNQINLPSLDRETLKTVTEVASAAGAKGFNVSAINKSLEKDPKRVEKLYEVYAGIKDGKKDAAVTGLDDTLLKKFEKQYQDEPAQQRESQQTTTLKG